MHQINLILNFTLLIAFIRIYILSGGREVGSPVNTPSRAADQTDQPFSLLRWAHTAEDATHDGKNLTSVRALKIPLRQSIFFNI